MRSTTGLRGFAAALLLLACGWCHAAPGLVASYFNNKLLTGSPALVRIDPTVNYDWGKSSPAASINNDNFSARWVGVVRVQTTGSYNFQTISDDGVRLYVNGVLVINNWTDHAATTNNAAPVTLTAGVDYPIKLEFYENGGLAVMKLNWQKPGDAGFSAIPASNGSLGLATGLTPMLEYHFEEPSWAGTAAEILDTSGNAWNALAAGLSATKPTTASASPALAGTTGTCRYGVFNRANKDYVALPSTLPNLGASGGFTATAWIRTTNNSLTGQRIFADDENGYASTTVGTLLSLGDRGAGTLTFITRGNASQTELITGSVIANNTWYFVAFGVDDATKTKFIYVYSTGGSQLAGVTATYTEASIVADNGNASLGGETNNAGGSENTSSFGFGGNLDEVRIFPYALTTTEMGTVRGLTTTCAPPLTLVSEYRFEEGSWNGTPSELTDFAGAAGGPYHGVAQGSPLPATGAASPARSGSPGTCGYASLLGPRSNGSSFIVNGLPLSTAVATQTSLAFWMYWDGSDDVIVAGWSAYDLYFKNGFFGFNTNNGDVYGTSSVGLANGWHHVVAVFTNGSVTSNRLYIDGMAMPLAQNVATPNLANAVVSSSLTVGGYGASTSYRFSGRLDELRVYTGAANASEVAAVYAQTHTCTPPLHHLEIRHATGTGLTCTPSTVSVVACQDASCGSLYTGGVSGTLTATGAGMTVNWPTGAAFSIVAGSSSTTQDLQLTTVGSVVLGISGASPATSSATSCNFGSPTCTFTGADAGLLFDVPDHRAEVSVPFTVTAVRKSDNSSACTPAFANVTKAVTFKCAYSNPASGTLPVRVGGAALNAGNSSTAACDAGGRAVSLAFNAGGVASSAVQYADVGRLTLTATYTGSGSDAGLVMTGTDSFVAAPYLFGVGGITAGNLTAGNAFAATVTANNYAGNITPNFGRETTPEAVVLGFVRAQPSGAGASNGSFSGSTGAFAAGTASGANLQWSEVGRGDVSAMLASASYLGTGMTAAGSSAGGVNCAGENGTCTLPTGATAFVVYGAAGYVSTRSNMTGSVGCNNSVFGDPIVGTYKSCTYYVTSGAAPGTTGAAGRFVPHHFDVAVAPTCSSFTYAGQPFTATVTARNAANNTTVNYDGSSATSPNFAKAVTLTDAPALGVGNFGSTGTLAATLFTAGIATSSAPAYTFTSKLTAAQSLRVRATDADAVNSAGFAEGTTALRSGRLRLSNAFGSEKAALVVPVQAQYWSGNTWVANSADSCTTVPAAAVVRAAYLDNKGAATTAWTSSASAVVVSAGAGSLTLGAPSPTSTGSLDFALNLGSSAADQSCLAAHPASAGSTLPWLRSQNGACASAWAADPSARATFGIYAPETRKTIHVREIF